jgi:hypothetical protein
MEEEEPHALEMGKKEAQTAQKEDEKKGRRALTSFPDFLIFFYSGLERRAGMIVFRAGDVHSRTFQSLAPPDEKKSFASSLLLHLGQKVAFLGTVGGWSR